MTKKLVSYNDAIGAGSRLPPAVATEIALYISNAFNAFIAGAPGALDTWLELTAAIQADQSGLGTLTTLVNTKLSGTLVDAKGDLLVGTADNTVGRLAVGADTYLLMADATQAGGMKWTNVLVNPKITNYTETKYAGGNTGTAKTIDLANGTVQAFTLTGNCVFTMPLQPNSGESKSFAVLLNTGAGSLTGIFTGVKWPAGTVPTVTTTAARLDLFTFIADGTNWYGSVVQNYTP